MSPRAEPIAAFRALQVDLARAIEDLLQADTVRCGITDADPQVEEKVQEARAVLGASVDREGCGRLIALGQAYRCVECGRWFHRACAQAHFQAHSSAPPR